tara:strand:- start:207 stop:674 length:468 start_codon:yes stop_codon:yes gene_type:complete
MYVRQARLIDTIELARNIKRGDRDELKASDNVTPLEALVYGFTWQRIDNYTVIGDTGNIIGMFGVRDCIEHPRAGVAYLLSSEELISSAYRLRFLRQCLDWTEILLQPYDYIYNWVDARNWASLRWLEHCKFEIEETDDAYGYEQRAFHRLVRRK